MAPPRSSPRDRPAMVTVGMSEFLNACLKMTRNVDSPLALAVVMGKGHYRQQDVQLYADRFANMLRQAKAENFGVDGEDDLHRARKQAAGAPRVIRSSETVVERDDTPYWDIYRNTRN